MDSLLRLQEENSASKQTNKTLSQVSFKLNILLGTVTCLFMISSVNYVYRQRHNGNFEKQSDRLLLTTANMFELSQRTKTYFDFEEYLKNGTFNKITSPKTRQFYFIDVGCFDGRDIDHFIHFHSKEIEQTGKLNVIAFDADPINFAACKSTQKRHQNIPHKMINSAAWIVNGQIPYSLEKGQKSRIDNSSSLYVDSIDFSSWLARTVAEDDHVYIKLTVEGAEIAILEKLVHDQTLNLVDYLDIEWHDGISADLEPRRVSLECMFDNFGMDFLFMINPVDARHAFNVAESFSSVPKLKDWRLKDSTIRFHYKARKDVLDLLALKYQPSSKTTKKNEPNL